MEIKALSPNLMVKNVQQTADFYQNLLGFHILVSVPHAKDSNSLQWAMVQAGGVTLMFQEEGNLKEEYLDLASQTMGGTFTLYFTVTDIEQVYRKAKQMGPVLKELHQTFYGATEFAIKDINGYILTIGEQASSQ
jgi:uncharacterized glyoxalase superfamily protein PhnB